MDILIFKSSNSQNKYTVYSLIADNWRKQFVKVNIFNLKKSPCNKSKSQVTIRLYVRYPVIFNHFPSFGEVYNFIDISVFKLLKVGFKLLLLNVS